MPLSFQYPVTPESISRGVARLVATARTSSACNRAVICKRREVSFLSADAIKFPISRHSRIYIKRRSPSRGNSSNHFGVPDSAGNEEFCKPSRKHVAVVPVSPNPNILRIWVCDVLRVLKLIIQDTLQIEFQIVGGGPIKDNYKMSPDIQAYRTRTMNPPSLDPARELVCVVKIDRPVKVGVYMRRRIRL